MGVIDNRPYIRPQIEKSDFQNLINNIIKARNDYDNNVKQDLNSKMLILQDQMMEEVDKTDLTLFTHNYMGPGTRIATNILEGREPVSLLDKISLVHDIELLKYDSYQADKNFYTNVQRYGSISDKLANIAIDSLFTIKAIIPFVESKLIEEHKEEVYEAAKDIVIMRHWVESEMFLENKNIGVTDDIIYSLTHPITSIKEGVLSAITKVFT